MPEVYMLKSDAQINISVGAPFLKKVQELIVSIVSERTPEELDAYRKEVEGKNMDLPETWMQTLLLLTLLNDTIEKEAKNQSLTYTKSIEDTTKQ